MILVRYFRSGAVFVLLGVFWILAYVIFINNFNHQFFSVFWFFSMIIHTAAGILAGHFLSTKKNKMLNFQETERSLLHQVSEDMIFEAEERFYKAFYSNPALMALTEFNTGKFIDVNQSFLTALGCSRQEVVGKKPSELIRKIEGSDLFLSRLRKEGGISNLETAIILKSGKKLEVLFSLETIELDGEKSVLAVAKDISHTKELQKEMARLDRLNLIGEMAAGIGHEIRNPMTAVRGFLQIMDNRETDSQKKEYYNLMIEELDRANSIITEYLSLAKDKAVTLNPQSLNIVINSLYPLLSVDAIKQEKQIKLIKGEIPVILVNEKEIRQLILNLVKNGLDAMKAGGILTIGTFEETDEVVLYVEDEGPGIEPDILDKLGNPFVTTKEHGTGLGIPVCYSIAKRHNARINIETSPHGTRFLVRFSLIQGE